MIPLCQDEASVSSFPKCLFACFSIYDLAWMAKGKRLSSLSGLTFPQAREADMALSKCMRVPRGLLRTEKEEGETVHWVLLSEHAVWEKTICVLSLRD